jgi:S-(hydroxymethyl)glutathione dehydrogenase/alcohol dehydrogenase
MFHVVLTGRSEWRKGRVLKYREFVAPVLHRSGEPQVMDIVELQDPQPGEVVVRMVAAGVCHSCLSTADGSFGEIPLPMILGDEGAGVVETVGDGCRSLQPGDHVILSWAPSCGRCRFCTTGRPGICETPAPLGRMSDGTTRFRVDGVRAFHMGPSTYSPYVVVDESAAVRVTPAIPLDTAALIGCAVTTGVGAVLNTAKVRVGESVAVFGCGGVGLNAVQGAALAGAHPIIAVDVLESKLEAASGLGATATVRSGQEDPVERIRSLTGGGVDHAIVAVGAAPVMETAVTSLGRSGQCVLVGAPPFGTAMSVDPFLLVGSERRLVGSRYGSSNPQVAFPQLVDLYLAGKLKLDELITNRYPMHKVNEASAALASGADIRGVLTFD